MLKKILSISFVCLLSFQLEGCAIAPPDGPLCTELDITRGWCTNTISSNEFYIDDQHPWSPTGKPEDAKTWWDLRPFMIQMPYPTWVEIKTFIVKICKKTNACSKQIANWERSVNGMDQQLNNKIPKGK